ncbi:MAG: helix-hairpin-helix domain-containing protein [Saprospiraceae bacterium]
MNNKEIAYSFSLLADLMEIHGENPFKIKSYQNAYRTIRSLDKPLGEFTQDDWSQTKGIGKAILGKIEELLQKGTMDTLEQYLSKTPEGLIEMFSIKGFGPKKIKALWTELGIESLGELSYAISENRLLELKGFGPKTQEDLKNKIAFFKNNKGYVRYATADKILQPLLNKLNEKIGEDRFVVTGDFRQRMPILNQVSILIKSERPDSTIQEIIENAGFSLYEKTSDRFNFKFKEGWILSVRWVAPEQFGWENFQQNSPSEFLEAFQKEFKVDTRYFETEKALFDHLDLDYIPPEIRWNPQSIKWALAHKLPHLINQSHQKGIIHNHSTYSDGTHSLAQMAEAVQQKGYEYFVISDHSQSAFYANGLTPERVLKQMDEIDRLNQQLAPFKIFKSIESDILNDGSLDYPIEILDRFDLVIASIHSNLKMDKEKATNRILAAIRQKHTNILGHPTGRLLLSREGYPIDHLAIIDACAENNVAIELNANPFRLDIDWSWIPYAIEKNVLISINPDAHAVSGIDDVQYGIQAARKGLLTPNHCLSCYSLAEFENWIAVQKKKRDII